jgi:hypothetical protein
MAKFSMLIDSQMVVSTFSAVTFRGVDREGGWEVGSTTVADAATGTLGRSAVRTDSSGLGLPGAHHAGVELGEVEAAVGVRAVQPLLDQFAFGVGGPHVLGPHRLVHHTIVAVRPGSGTWG